MYSLIFRNIRTVTWSLPRAPEPGTGDSGQTSAQPADSQLGKWVSHTDQSNSHQSQSLTINQELAPCSGSRLWEGLIAGSLT